MPVLTNPTKQIRSKVALVLLLAIAAGGGPNSSLADALDIQLVFFSEADDAVDPCVEELPACGHDDDLHVTMQVAADHWSRIFRDDHTITIRYYWFEESLPDARILEFDALGRPTLARIRIPAGSGWLYADPTSDDDFEMEVRLFRTTHPDEQMEAFLGTPPEVFEVGYVGRHKNYAAFPASHGDLFTTVLHEMGHALGLARTLTVDGPNPSCSQNDPYFYIDPALAGDALIGIKAFEKQDETFDCSHLAAGGITACKNDPDENPLSDDPSTFPPLTVYECTSHQALMWVSEYPRSRTRPSVTDILSVAKAAGWQVIHLPRKYALASGIWDDSDNWLGGRIPEGDDDVYVVNREPAPVTVSAFEPAQLANLFVSDGNAVAMFFWPFTVSGQISVVDEGSEYAADTGAQVTVGRIEVGAGARLHLWIDASIDANLIESSGTIRGADAVIEVLELRNSGTIRANGGNLAFIPASPNATFDLNGNASVTHIEALTGDLEFFGPISSPLRSDIKVGAGYSITFGEGWAQQASFNSAHRLEMHGESAEATIHGESVLAALVLIDGAGRFTDNVIVNWTARFEFSVGGAGHDQIRIDGALDLVGGELAVTLEDEFVPAVNQRFSLFLHGPRTGEFNEKDFPPLDGGLEFLLDYREDRIDLVAGFAGATPGAPNCGGQATSTQASLHGGIKQAAEFHGFPSVKAFHAAIKEFCDG